MKKIIMTILLCFILIIAGFSYLLSTATVEYKTENVRIF